MKPARQHLSRQAANVGFTLVEMLIAVTISGLLTLGVITVFIWSAKQATLCGKIAWSHNQAMNTSEKLTLYMRNASEVVAIDEVEGTWVELGFPDGSTIRLAYSNDVPNLRDGRLYMQRTNGTEKLVARGLTEIQDAGGFTTPIFSQTRANALRVAYRVSEPAASGGRDADDGLFAASVRFGVCLRNVEE